MLFIEDDLQLFKEFIGGRSGKEGTLCWRGIRRWNWYERRNTSLSGSITHLGQFSDATRSGNVEDLKC